jgi:hypothetical protein
VKAADGALPKPHMLRFSANLSTLFQDLPLRERFAPAADAPFIPDGHLKLLHLIWARQGDYELESEVAVMRETASLSR